MRSPEIIGYEPSFQSQLESFFREVWQQSRFPFDPEGTHSDVRYIPTQYQVNGGGFWLMRLSDQIMLAEYGRIPIAFEVNEICDVSTGVDGRFRLTPRRLHDSYVKDYDAISERPEDWPRCFDTSNWGFFAARADGGRIGGAVVAWRTPRLEMLEGRSDLAVLWDIRVAPLNRHQGIGSALFAAATAWAAGQGARQLKVETQNINVAACRFYARQGCVLLAANRGVYSGLPGEIQLLWYKDLDQEPSKDIRRTGTAPRCIGAMPMKRHI